MKKIIFAFYSIFFLILSILELKYSIPDSFVLFTVSLTYAYSVRKEYIYSLAASILSIVFAILSTLSLISAVISNLMVGKLDPSIVFSQLGVFGFVSFPVIYYILKKKRLNTD